MEICKVHMGGGGFILIFDMVVNAINYVLGDRFTLFEEQNQHITVTTLCLLWYFFPSVSKVNTGLQGAYWPGQET